MRSTEKSIGCIALICLLSCFLVGCPSPRDESKQAEQHAKQAISLAEEELPKYYPNARIKANTFYGISGVDIGPDHRMTDWVRGKYLDGGEETILINVLTKEIFVTSEWYKINSYGRRLVTDLYGLDDTNMRCSVVGYMERPYCIDDPDKYGNLIIGDVLPLGAIVNDDFARNLMNNDDYSIEYMLEVNEDVDMKIFEETDHSQLGSNVQIQVKQYDNEYFRLKGLNYNTDPGPDEPIATFDSEKYRIIE